MKSLLLGLLAVFWSSLAMGQTQTLYTFNGGGTTGDWNTASTWTTDPTGSTAINQRVPQTNDNVVVTNSFIVTIGATVATTGLNVTVQRGGQLDLGASGTFSSTLSSLSGQGVLRIGAPYFPIITTNNFDDPNTGTVEFYNWPAGSTALPQPASNLYNNLRLLNTTATAYAVQLDNNLTLSGNLSLTRTNTNGGVTLNLGKAATARTLSVQGDITVGVGTTLGVSAVDLPTTGSNPAVQTFHTLTVSGSFINNGTVNLHNGTTGDKQTALLTFTGAIDANFACNGATDLDILKVDKGNDSKVLLNITSTRNVSGNALGNLRLNHVANGDLLVLVNGITKLTGATLVLTKIHNGSPSPADLTNTSGWYQLGTSTTSPTLWIAGATVNNDNASLFAIYGIYRISGGSLSSVNDGGMVIREDAQVLIEGGTTTVNKFRPSSTAATHRGSFTMTGGLFQTTGAILNSSYDDQFSRFALPYATQAFRMSGGTIEVSNPGGSGDGLFHVGVNPNNAVVSGGTINLILPSSTTDAKIVSTAPLWNLSITKPTSSSSKAILSAMTTAFAAANTTIQPLTVLHDFTIDGGSNAVTFDAANQAVTIQGSFTIGTNATYLPGTNTTIFNGGLDQLLTNNGTIGTTAGVGTFNNWTMDKSAGTLTLAGSNSTFAVSGTLSLLGGVLSDGGKTINTKGNIVNSASHTSGGGSGSIVLNGNGSVTGGQVVSGDGTGVFGNLKLNCTSTTTGIVAATFTANMSVASTLTMQSTHILAIGANRLSLTNVNSSTTNGALVLGPGNNFTTSCFIQTAGNQSDLGLQKTYGKGDSFTFPVGTGVGSTARYAPATIALQLASSAPLDKFGQVSVSPTNSRNPFVTGTTTSLAYYWKVRSVGFGPIPTGSVYETFTMTNADASGTLSNYVPGRYQPTMWNKYTTGDMSIGSSVSFINFNALNVFEGEFTAGYPAAFGPITAFYSIKSGNWEAPGTWSTTSYNGAASTSAIPGAGNPVFIGSADNRAYHTVLVTAAGAKSGSLVIDRGSTLDVQALTGHNFGALPDAKIGGAGRLRVSATGTTPLVATFPGGDFGSFIQYGGGTVEYYTSGIDFTLPTTSNSGSLTLNQYRNLWLSAASGRTITLPNQNLRMYAQLKTGTQGGTGLVVMSTGANGNLRVDSLLNVQAGTFRYPNTTARQVTVDTNVQVDANATFDVATSTATAVANTLTIGNALTDSPLPNSLLNNGTLDFRVGTALVGLTFTGSNTTALTGSSGVTTDLNTLTVNKGIGRASTLNIDVAGTFTTPANPTNNWLTLTNGTLRFAKTNGTLTIHDLASSYLITDNAGLTVDGSGATVTVATNTSKDSDLRLAGQLQVLQGTLNVGTSSGAGNDLEYASAGAPGLKVSGTGALYVNGQLRRTVNNLDGSLRFDQSGGTIDIDGQGATAAQNNERGLFEVQGKGSIFRMSSGTLNLHRSNGRPTFTADLYLAPDSTVVTGGTVVLGNAAAGVGNVIISANSTVPLYNLRVETGANNTNTNTGLLAGVIPLTLKGSLTIGNDNSFFNANSLGLNIYQNLVNNNTSSSTALNAGGFQPIAATQTTTFLGGIPTQLLTGTATNLTVFGSLALANPQASGTLQLGGNAWVTGTLTLTKGTLDDNGKIITVLGDVLNSATHTSGGPKTGYLTLAGAANQNIGGNGTGRFGNLKLENSLGATTTANQEITQVLTLNSGVFTIGSNLLWLSNPATGAVANFTPARFIRTNGIVADLGVRKSYPSGASNFTFPIGANTTYAPVQMNVTASSSAGYIAVQPVDLTHPSLTGPGTNKISLYWKVSSNLSNPTVDQKFTYGDNDVVGDETKYKVGRFYSGAWTPVGGITTSSVDAAANTLSNLGYSGTGGSIDGDYTGGTGGTGSDGEFGNVRTYYSRNSTAGQTGGANWNDIGSTTGAWTFNNDGTDSSPLPAAQPTLANPVVIRSGHLINSNGTSRGAATLQLDGTLDLSSYGANNFSTVTGTGTLRIGSALFPAGNYLKFVAANGGTVDYSGVVQLPARDTYNNLTFSGGNGKQLSNLDLTINGALTLATGTTVDNPTSQNITLTSATSGATLNGTFNLNDGTLTTGAFLTNGGTLTLGAGLTSVGTNFTNSGTLNNGTSGVTVGAAFSNSGIYKANLGTGGLTVGTTFTNSKTYTAGTGVLNVASDFNNVATGTFTAASGNMLVGGNFSNAGTYQAAPNILRLAGNFTNTGSFAGDASTTSLYGNFTNKGSFDPGTGLMQFITDTNSLLVGNTTFYDVQKVSKAYLSLDANTTMTVAHLLTLRGGFIVTGTSGTLALTYTGMQPIVGASATSYVAGRLQMTLPDAVASIRTFPVGLGGRYRPVTITPQDASTSPVVLVEIFNKAPTGSLDGTLSNMSANRYYRIQLQSGTIGKPSIQLSFNTDVVDEEVHIPGNMRVASSSSPTGPWSTAGGAGVFSPNDPRGYTTSAGSQTTINSTSFFALASTNKVDNPLTGSAPLPIELLSFSAVRQGPAVRVDWATASEHNSAYFEVQRSADGQAFSSVQQVAALGSSVGRHDYAALDASPLAGTSYYRLRQVDLDGKETYSAAVAVHFEGEAAAPTMVAYPNPNAGQRFQLLTTNLPATGGTVQLFDNVGRLVLTQVATPGTVETTIQPAQALASGIYFATWQTADGLRLTTKVVVN